MGRWGVFEVVLPGSVNNLNGTRVSLEGLGVEGNHKIPIKNIVLVRNLLTRT